MKRVTVLSVVFVSSMGMASQGAAQAGGMKDMEMKGMEMKGMDRKAAKGAVHKASGTITKVDREKGRVTINHGPISSMSWPSMTMAFDVKDKALLDKAKQGAKVEFSFVESGKKHVITDIK